MNIPWAWAVKLFAYANTGLLIEVWFTGLWSVVHRNPKAQSTTFLWSGLIYGLAAMQLEALHNLLNLNALLMAVIYTIVIYTNEFTWGWFFDRVYPKKRLWDYGHGKLTILGYITFAYLPFWLTLSFAFECFIDKYGKFLN